MSVTLRVIKGTLVAGAFLTLRSTISELGWLDGLLYLFHEAARRATGERFMFRKYYLVSQPVPGKRLLPVNRAASISVRQVYEDDDVVKSFPRPRDVLDRRFASGAKCFIARKGERFAGFLWLKSDIYDEDEVRCRFRPLPAGNTVWDFDVHVEPEHRGSLVFAKLWDEANEILRVQGVLWSVSRISAFNRGSLQSHAKLGAIPVGSACFFSIGKFQVTLSPARPFFHLSTDAGSWPEIVIRADRPKAIARFDRILKR